MIPKSTSRRGKGRKIAPFKSINGFPDSTQSVHRYSQYVNLDPSMGAATKQVFRANSLYDPDLTGTGHQPMGRDELSAVYGHYLVTNAKITVTNLNFGSTNYPGAWGILLDDDGTVPNDAHAIIEQAGAKYRIFPNNYLASGVSSTLTCVFDASKFFHVKDPDDVKYEIGALTGTNPADGAYFVLWVGPLDSSSDLNGNAFEILIEYTTTWSERSTMVQS